MLKPCARLAIRIGAPHHGDVKIVLMKSYMMLIRKFPYRVSQTMPHGVEITFHD